MEIIYTLVLHQSWYQTLLLSFGHISPLIWILHTSLLWSLSCREFRNVVIYTRATLYGCYRKPFQSLARWHSTAFSIPGIVLESRRVNMCSPQDLPFLNPACSLRSIGLRAVDILSRITLQNTLLVMDNSVIPLQFLQRLRFPFFGSLTISPVFQSTGISSSSHISLNISVRVLLLSASLHLRRLLLALSLTSCWLLS